MKEYAKSLFDYLEIDQKDAKSNIDNGIIDYLTKDFDMLKIPELFGLYEDGFKYLKDLKYQKLTSVSLKVVKPKRELFVSWIQLIEYGKDYYINNFEKAIEKLDNFEILKMRSQKMSLSDIGKQINVTRERVRQIILSLEQDAFAYIYPIIETFEVDNEKLFFHFYEYFNTKKENEELLSYCLLDQKNKYENFDKDFCAFYHKNKKHVIQKIKKIISENDLFHIYDMYVRLNNLMVYSYNIYDFTFEIYEKYLINTKHYITGKLVSKEKKKRPNEILSKVIYLIYPKGIVLDEKGISDLEKKVEEKFECQFSFTSAVARIDELNPELIVFGKQMRIHIDNVIIKENIHKEIIGRFEQLFINYSYLLLDDIYLQMTDVLDKTILKDKYKLYGYLKYYLKDKYYFKKMAVRKLGLKDKQISNMIYDFIKENPNNTLQEIAFYFDMDEKSVLSILRDDKRILAVDDKYLLAESFVITKEKLDEIKLMIDEKIKIDEAKLQFGYIHRDNLFEANKEKLLEMNITCSSVLYQLSRYYFDNDYVFLYPYIQIKDINYQVTFKKIISDYFDLNKGIIDIEKAQKDIGYLLSNKEFSLIYNLRTYNIDYFRMGYDRMTLSTHIRFDQVTEYVLKSRLDDYFKDHQIAFEKDLELLCKGLYYYINNEKCFMNYYSLCSYIDVKNTKKYYSINSLGINNYISCKYALSTIEQSYLEAIYKIVREKFPSQENSRLDIIRFLKENKLLNSIPNGLFSKYARYEEDKIIFNQ